MNDEQITPSRAFGRSIRLLLADALYKLPVSWRASLLWPESRPKNKWNSFDRTPWQHPWLSLDHLSAMKVFSGEVRAYAIARFEQSPPADRENGFGFVGNIANGMYLRAQGLRRAGLAIDVIGAPGDSYPMSNPGWAEFDGDIGGEDLTGPEVQAKLPKVDRFFELPLMSEWETMRLRQYPEFVRISDCLRWPAYLSRLPTLIKLQEYQALLAAQVPYLAYLSGRPYLVTQCGGDIWYDCARDDDLGRLQRLGFRRASAFLVSNPWSFAHARRYGMRHLIYLPMVLDEETYCPGNEPLREQWKAQSGGDFFVLSTSRVDEFYKGSSIGLEGFAEFSRVHSGARLLQLAWGTDLQPMRQRLADLGLGDRVIILRPAGKRRLISYLRAADCLLDQFRLGYFGATALEAMACGLPVIMRLEREQYDALCETGAPPVLEAGTPHEVYLRLKELSTGAERHIFARQQHRRWFLENHGSGKWSESYFALLLMTARRQRFDFSSSPLCKPLSGEEREYHARELANAPAFPNYH